MAYGTWDDSGYGSYGGYGGSSWNDPPSDWWYSQDPGNAPRTPVQKADQNGGAESRGTYDADGWAMSPYAGADFRAPTYGPASAVNVPQGGAGMVSAVGRFDPGAQFQSPVGAMQDPGFQAPTMAQVESTPGYEFRRREGERAIENAAAAQGIGRTGGAMKDLLRYGQDYASGEYDKAYGRAIGENQMAYQRALQANQDQYGRSLGEYQMGYGQRQDVYGRDMERATAEARLAETGAGRSLAAQRMGMDARLQAYDRDYQAAIDQYRYPYQRWQDQDTRAWQRTIYPVGLGMQAEQVMDG